MQLQVARRRAGRGRPPRRRDPLAAARHDRRRPGPGTPPASLAAGRPAAAPADRDRAGPRPARRAGRPRRALRPARRRRATTTARRSRASRRPGGAATRCSPRSRCPTQADVDAVRRCTRRCSTPRCTPLGCSADPPATGDAVLPFSWQRRRAARHRRHRRCGSASPAGDAGSALTVDRRRPAPPSASVGRAGHPAGRRRARARPAGDPLSATRLDALDLDPPAGAPRRRQDRRTVTAADAGRRGRARPPRRRRSSRRSRRPAPRLATASRRRRLHRAEALAVLQAWLADERFARTRGAGGRCRRRGRRPTSPGAAVWGLVRSAQAEHPDRVRAGRRRRRRWPLRLPPARADEPQLAVRGGVAVRRRALARVGTPPTPAAAGLVGDGTVLVTGGTGALGAAGRPAPGRARTGSATCCWLSRRGRTPRAPRSCSRELTALGARGRRSAACDVADRDAWPSAGRSRPSTRSAASCTPPACSTTASSRR